MQRILYLLIDLLIVFGGIILSFYLLDNNNMLADFQRNFTAFKIITPFIAILYVILWYAFGLYNVVKKEVTEIIYSVFLTSVSLMIGIMGICFFVRDLALAFPRSVILSGSMFYFLLLSIWYILLWYISRKVHGTKKIAIVGKNTSFLIEAIKTKYSHLYQIESIFSECNEELLAKVEFLDEIFVSSDIKEKERKNLILLCMKYKKEVCFIPKYLDLTIMSSSFYKTDDIPTYRISKPCLSPEEQFVKRLFDLLFAFIALLLCLPFGLIISVFVKLDGGPIFYAQERLTQDGKIFKILKFRTMIPDAEKKTGPVLAGENDPRITKVGRFIRAVRLDEIPQLLNILKGDMSIVGPRPERPHFTEQFEEKIPEYSYRLNVKAGLTGLAQIEGKYNTSVENKLRYDIIYINKYSVLRDLLIMLQTVKILFLKNSTEGIKE